MTESHGRRALPSGSSQTSLGLEEALTTLVRLVQQRQAYARNHVRTQGVAAELATVVTVLASPIHGLEVTVGANDLWVGPDRSPAQATMLRVKLQPMLRQRGVSVLRILPSARPDDLIDLAEVLLSSPSDVVAEGGVAAALAKRGTQGVVVGDLAIEVGLEGEAAGPESAPAPSLHLGREFASVLLDGGRIGLGERAEFRALVQSPAELRELFEAVGGGSAGDRASLGRVAEALLASVRTLMPERFAAASSALFEAVRGLDLRLVRELVAQTTPGPGQPPGEAHAMLALLPVDLHARAAATIVLESEVDLSSSSGVPARFAADEAELQAFASSVAARLFDLDLVVDTPARRGLSALAADGQRPDSVLAAPMGEAARRLVDRHLPIQDFCSIVDDLSDVARAVTSPDACAHDRALAVGALEAVLAEPAKRPHVRWLAVRSAELARWRANDDVVAIFGALDAAEAEAGAGSSRAADLARARSEAAGESVVRSVLASMASTDGEDAAAERVLAYARPDAQHLVLDALCGEPSRKRRARQFAVLRGYGDAIVPHVARRLTRDAPWYVLRNMAILARGRDALELVDRLLPLLRHDNEKVVREVIETLTSSLHAHVTLALAELLGPRAGALDDLVIGALEKREIDDVAAEHLGRLLLAEAAPERGARITRLLARGDTDGCVAALAAAFARESGFLSMRADPVVATVAAALRTMCNPAASRALEEGSRSSRRALRKACLEAMEIRR